MTVHEKILQNLNEQNVRFELVHHAPTYTSEASAIARNEVLEVGAKALVIKVDQTFMLFVMSAVRKLDSKLIKAIFKAKKVRFATSEELLEQTGLVPGSVPPFGQPILPYPLIIDSSITDLPKVAFNAGSLTASIKMSADDYLKFSNGTVLSFTQSIE